MKIKKEHQDSLNTALEAVQAAAEEVARVETRRQSVTARMDELREQAAGYIDRAKQAETQAANDLAAAIASDAPPETLKVLEERMASATSALAEARQGEADGASLLDALAKQVEALTAKLDEAAEGHRVAKLKADRAQIAILSEQWNELVKLMLPIGAELAGLLPGDSGYYRTHEMKIPNFVGDGYFTRRDLLDAGKSVPVQQ
ncbi:hypothetical protein [Stutzerimonas stutzeri]|uniref:hypothetical protein n=1 Tax=Stutzerimonas stutzeri TaxID=316 RepID=UPI001BD11102|nr:hypothetical protein [Stutzerimonas stutzeri]